MMLRRRPQNALLHHGELCRRLIDVLAHAGGNLKHAFGDIVFNFTAFDVVFNGGDKRGRVLAQIVSRWVNHLQLEFDAKGIGFRGFEIG